jgi:hypothetical protein
MLALFRWLWLRQPLARVVPAKLVAFLCFAVVAGPYVAALSHQKGRLDFGDSGALNYAWYVGGTEKMHLEPHMTSQFGSAEIHLKHPEKQLLQSPPIYSYAEFPYGTYPDWFDTTYWNEQVKPHLNLRGEISRGSRNLVLVVRYLFNHPEAWTLLALLILLGARPTLRWRPGANAFWLAPLLLGAAIWGIYAIVNTEERYVTVAYLSIVLTLFATLRDQPPDRAPSLRATSSALVLLLALLAIDESVRTVFEDRRTESGLGYPGGWYSPDIFHAAEGLRALGVKPGDTVACIGQTACLHDFYWARLAQVRVLTEIYYSGTDVDAFLEAMPNRDQAIAIVRGQGAKALIGNFDQARVSDSDPATREWKQLGDTTFYALPLN